MRPDWPVSNLSSPRRRQDSRFRLQRHVECVSKWRQNLTENLWKLTTVFPPLSVHRGSIITRSLLSCLPTLNWMVLPVFRRAELGWIWRRFIILSSLNDCCLTVTFIYLPRPPGSLLETHRSRNISPKPRLGLSSSCWMRLTWPGVNKRWPLTSGGAEDLLQLSAMSHANFMLSNSSSLRVCFQPPVWRWIFSAHHSHKRGIGEVRLGLFWDFTHQLYWLRYILARSC